MNVIKNRFVDFGYKLLSVPVIPLVLTYVKLKRVFCNHSWGPDTKKSFDTANGLTIYQGCTKCGVNKLAYW